MLQYLVLHNHRVPGRSPVVIQIDVHEFLSRSVSADCERFVLGLSILRKIRGWIVGLN